MTDDKFGNFEFNDPLKRIQKEIEEIEKAIGRGTLTDEWEVTPIQEPGVQGYVFRGRFTSDEPFEPLRPFNPLEPWRRRPTPQRPFISSENAVNEIQEPLTDVFEQEDSVKIYVALLGEEKDDIQLNATEGSVEVKSKRYYTMIDLPTRNIDIEKASSKHKNGVLEVTIPKKEAVFEKEKKRIRIE